MRRGACSSDCASIIARRPCSSGHSLMRKRRMRSERSRTQTGQVALNVVRCVYFGGHLLETYSSTQQIVALSTSESEYMSITKGAVHGLESRIAIVGWTGGHWPRDVASAVCVIWMRVCYGRSNCAQKVWWKCEPSLESTTSQTWERRWLN